MSKTEFAAYLREHGYAVEIENGVVTVVNQDKNTFAEMVALANKAGYTMSMGWRKGETA